MNASISTQEKEKQSRRVTINQKKGRAVKRIPQSVARAYIIYKREIDPVRCLARKGTKEETDETESTKGGLSYNDAKSTC